MDDLREALYNCRQGVDFMPKNPNQKLKLLYLMKILQERTDENHDMTLSEIQDELARYGIKAERKSLYDDIEALRVFGIDIEKRRSKTHGYYIASRAFELPELKLLVDAVQSSKFITRRKSDELIKKVESLASVHEAQMLQRQVYVANRIKTMNESIYYNIDTIHAAISQGKKVSFKYSEWVVSFSGNERFRKQFRKGGQDYVISPWALTWDDEYYYMVGFDSEAGIIKHYRVDMMSEIDITDLKRDGQEHFERFDMAVYARGVFGMFGGGEETVRLKFANHLIGVVVDRFGRDVFISREDEDHFSVSVRVAVSPHFLSWVFGFGEDVRILTPGHVIDQFCEHAKKVISLY